MNAGTTAQAVGGPVLEAVRLTKRFPGVVALSGVDFSLQPGEVHALVGENGAGKSTLIKLLSGSYSPDEGEVRIDGRRLPARTVDARAAGIATVHQEHNLVPFLSVAENVMLGGWSERRGLVRPRQLRDSAEKALERVGARVSATRPARSLSAAQGQLVEIARALAQQARVLILDEPTTALSEEDVDRLFPLLRELRERGMAILYVSHKLDEILELAERITVLRDGATVASGPATEFDSRKLIRAMVGEDIELYDHHSHTPGKVVLETRGLERRGVLSGVDLTVRSGEVLGLAGLVGAGRSELARCLFGADRIDEGAIFVNGELVTLKHPADAIRAGIGLVPEERKEQAIIEALSVGENIALSLLDQLGRYGVVSEDRVRGVAERFVGELNIRTPSTETRIADLSGGNQQKVVLARWLARDLKLLILDEPTKGIDVGAKAEVHRLIEGVARSGVAVLLISSELPELLTLSDRIAVMRGGQLVTTLSREMASKETVMSYAAAA